MGFFIVMDNVVNTLCILLMSSWYDKFYIKLCCWCAKTVQTLDETIAKSPRGTIPSSSSTQYHQQLASVDVSSTGSVQMSSNETRNTQNNTNYNEKKAIIPMKTVDEEKPVTDSEVP